MAVLPHSFLLLAVPAACNATFLRRSCACRSIARRFPGVQIVPVSPDRQL
jgi:hypothetical protein